MVMVNRWYRHASLILVLGLILSICLPGALPAAQAQTDRQCFEETGFCISGRIRQFWVQNDGLRVFGLPITEQRAEEIEGRSIQVQWFQRNRLELHPGNEPPFDVLLGRLGADSLELQGRPPFDRFPESNGQASGCVFFGETNQNVCGPILTAWRSNGLELDGQPGFTASESQALFGLPLSNARTETSGNGRQYTVQWFERARFEIHPEFAPPNNVQFGLLGAEVLNLIEQYGEDGAPFVADNHQIAFATNRGLDQQLFPGASPNGQFSYIYRMNTSGTVQTALTRNHVQPDQRPAWSPDGTRIAFESVREPNTGNTDVYVMNADGSRIRRLTTSPANDGFPAWSPDGTRIAYASEDTGDYEIYTIDADGNGGPTRVTNEPGIQNLHPTWSPDGFQIAYTANAGLNRGEWDIYFIGANGGSPTNLTRSTADDQSPDWASTGRIAFKSNRDGRWQIYTMNADGSNMQNISDSSDNDEEPTWSPDGRRIAYQTGRFGPSEIFVMDADGSNKRNLSNHPSEDKEPAWTIEPMLTSPDPCPDVPEPVNANLTPGKCISANEALEIDIYGFLANQRFEYSYTGPDGRVVSVPAGEGQVVNKYGQRDASGPIRFRPGLLSAGLWQFNFTFIANEGSFYGATVYVRVDP